MRIISNFEQDWLFSFVNLRVFASRRTVEIHFKFQQTLFLVAVQSSG